MSQQRSGRKSVQLVLLVIILSFSALLLTQLVSGCGSGGTADKGSSQETVLDPLPLTIDSLRQTVVSGIGDNNQLRDATITGEGTEIIVNVGLDRPLSCEDGSVEAIMAVTSQKIMPVLFEYPEVSRITITMFGVKQGVKSDDVAAEVCVTRESAREIDWSMFGPMTMSMMVTKYYIDPAIMGNSSAGSDGMGGIHS
ncbi:MAG: hypothetical protein HZB44_02140 [Actinobacteria bacterium]|nr:hypothetical protein [Actinomycetota bacterium]